MIDSTFPRARSLRRTALLVCLSLAATLGLVLVSEAPPAAAATRFASAPRPQVKGAARVGSRLTVAPGRWKPRAKLSYRWYRGTKAIKGATRSTYTLAAADRGARISVKVTGRAKGYTTRTRTSRQTSRVAAGRFVAGTPTISGTAAVGSTLTGTGGTWRPSATLTYQWYRGATAIPGATSSTYTAVAADRGHALTLRAAGSRSGYVRQTMASRATGAVAPGSFGSAPVPVVSGNAAVGSRLTASPGTWKPTGTLTYQWHRGASAVRGATTATYLLSIADAGSRMSVKVTGSRAGYTATTRQSAATAVVTGTVTGAVPTISGSGVVGETLTAHAGSWSPTGVTLRYQWKSNGSAIAGATGSTFVPTSAHLRASITVTVTGSRTHFGSRSATSAAVSIAAPSALGVNQRLERNGELWSPGRSHRLVLQSDGNLVLYGPSGVVWASGGSDADRVVLQDDGNLVSYNASGTARWSSGSWGTNGTRLVVQDDGNLVIYSADGTAMWTRGVVGWISVFAGSTAGGQPGTQSQSAPNLSSTLFRIYPVGKRLPVVCGVTNGQAVDGSATIGTAKSSTWHRLLWGDWVPDADFRTTVDGLVPRGVIGFVANEPNCGSGSTPSTPLPGINGWVFPIQPHARLTTYAGHGGSDFPVGNGTPVYAMSGGTVSIPAAYRVDSSWCPVPSAVGRTQQDLHVTSNRDGNTYRINYAHMSRFVVGNGQTVNAGDLLGYSGDRGCVTGPHLHIDIKLNGQANRVFPHDLIGWSY